MQPNRLSLHYYSVIFSVIFFCLLCSYRSNAQIRVVNMVPQLQSNQTVHDVETNLTVNPSNKLQVVGTAFTPDPMGGANAPIYISTDGGNTWALNSIVPGNDPTFGSNDISVRFAGSGNRLYIGDLRGNATLFTMNILRVPDFTSSALADLMLSRATVDQPYVQATTVLGGSGAANDRVFITANDRGSSPLPAGINLSLDARTAAAPAGAFSGAGHNKRGCAPNYAPYVSTLRFSAAWRGHLLAAGPLRRPSKRKLPAAG